MMRIVALLIAMAICISPAIRQDPARAAGLPIGQARHTWPATASNQSRSSSAKLCGDAGKEKITIKCNYTTIPRSASEINAEPRIVLNRAVLSFDVDDEGHMLVELTFTNAGSIRMSDRRTVYLAIDDDTDRNYLRRELPAVDLRKLEPGQKLTFSDRLLAPAFQPRRYIVHLWIPSSDPSLQFDAAHNFLLSSAGVADPSTGLNTLAMFTVLEGPPRTQGL